VVSLRNFFQLVVYQDSNGVQRSSQVYISNFTRGSGFVYSLVTGINIRWVYWIKNIKLEIKENLMNRICLSAVCAKLMKNEKY
jgi:hypothetical protein